MKNWMRRLMVAGIMGLVAAGLYGCGEKEGDANRSAIQLSATVVTSSVTNGHQHSVSIPFTDLHSSSQVNYTSSAVSGHTHVIALSVQQLTDLSAGMRVLVTSSTAADGHTHTWEIAGGNVLYESLCYNCHTNSMRGQPGMPGRNYTPLASQQAALANPSAAQLSTASAPDPNVAPPPPVTGAPDGVALYGTSCAGCHGVLASSSKRGRSSLQIRAAINNPANGMGSLGSLTDAQLQAIATALQ